MIYFGVHFEPILTHYDNIWSHFGAIREPSWHHVELKNHLGSSLGALFVLEIVFPTKTPAILEGFGDLLERFLEIFLYIF